MYVGGIILLKSKHVNLSGINGARFWKTYGWENHRIVWRASYYKKSIYRIFLSRLDGKKGGGEVVEYGIIREGLKDA